MTDEGEEGYSKALGIIGGFGRFGAAGINEAF